MKTLEMKEMERIEGGQVESCGDFMKSYYWLIDNGHFEQAGIIFDAYYVQYCEADQ